MLRVMTVLVLGTLALAGCSRVGGWFGMGETRGPATLEPKGGYPDAGDEWRQLMPVIAAARLETIPEGRLLVVTTNTPTKGWWDVALITETPQPKGRYQPDEDGVLRLRLVGNPPPPGSPEAGMAADPRVDSITVALPLGHAVLAAVTRIQITSAQNTLSLGR